MRTLAEADDRLEHLLRTTVQAAREERDASRAVRDIFAAIGRLVALADEIIKDSPAGHYASDGLDLPVPVDGEKPSYSGFSDLNAESVRRTYKARRLRDEVFGDATLFGEPAWDILLDAVDADIAGKSISISSVCAAAAVPPTTALRWITLLERKGLLLRIDDPEDRRRSFVRPTRLAIEKMQTYFSRSAKLR